MVVHLQSLLEPVKVGLMLQNMTSLTVRERQKALRANTGFLNEETGCKKVHGCRKKDPKTKHKFRESIHSWTQSF